MKTLNSRATPNAQFQYYRPTSLPPIFSSRRAFELILESRILFHPNENRSRPLPSGQTGRNRTAPLGNSSKISLVNQGKYVGTIRRRCRVAASLAALFKKQNFAFAPSSRTRRNWSSRAGPKIPRRPRARLTMGLIFAPARAYIALQGSIYETPLFRPLYVSWRVKSDNRDTGRRGKCKFSRGA